MHLSTFAGPTPGNSKFGDRVQPKISNPDRVANPYDIVPHVWNSVEIRQIPHLYGGKLALLAPAIEELAHWLDAHDYQHECPPQQWPAGPLTPGSLLSQIAFNHLDAYLQKAGILSDELNFLSLFKPITTPHGP